MRVMFLQDVCPSGPKGGGGDEFLLECGNDAEF